MITTLLLRRCDGLLDFELGKGMGDFAMQVVDRTCILHALLNANGWTRHDVMTTSSFLLYDHRGTGVDDVWRRCMADVNEELRTTADTVVVLLTHSQNGFAHDRFLMRCTCRGLFRVQLCSCQDGRNW